MDYRLLYCVGQPISNFGPIKFHSTRMQLA